jgi:hypothetical protein
MLAGGLDHRAGVEDVDVTLVGKTFGVRIFRAGSVCVRLADHRLGLFGQQAGVQRLARHQFRDERFVAQPRQVIGVAEVHLEEVAADAVPERRTAAFIGTAAQFGDHLLAEQLRKFGHEQQAPQRQQPAVAA